MNATLLVVLLGWVDDGAAIRSLRDRGARVEVEERPTGAVVVEVGLHKKHFTDDDLSTVGRFASLRTLNLQGASITDAGLKHLTGLRALTTLELTHTAITPAGLKTIAELPALDTLGYALNQITDEALRQLIALKLAHKLSQASGKTQRPKRIEEVEYLQLWEVALTDAGLKELAAFGNLQSLDLTGKNWTAAGLKHLAANKALNRLDITPVTDDSLKALREAGLLHVLLRAMGPQYEQRATTEAEVVVLLMDNRWQGVTEVGLKELATLPNLRHIDITQSHLSDSAMKVLAGFPPLLTLRLNHRISAESLAELEPLKSLETISFGGDGVPNFGDEHVKLLRKFPSLRSVSLQGTKVTATGLKDLAGTKLTALYLDRPSINDATLKVLREINLLHVCNVAFAKGGRRATSPDEILVVNLMNSEVTDAGLKELVGFTSAHTIVPSNKMTLAGFTELKKMMPKVSIPTWGLAK